MKNRDVIIVVCSIATAVVCIVLTWLGSYKCGGCISLESYYGVLATFIGICATLIVGLQIVNSLKIQQTEQRVKEIQIERNKMRSEQEALKDDIDYVSIELANVFTVIAGSSNIPFVRASCYLMSIVLCDIKLINADILLQRYTNLEEAIMEAGKDELQHLSKQAPKLKEIQIPINTEHYTEIMSLHIKVIGILENTND